MTRRTTTHNDEEAVDMKVEQTRRDRRGQSRHVGIMEQSGLTEAERHELRRAQRQLNQEIQSVQLNDDDDEDGPRNDEDCGEVSGANSASSSKLSTIRKRNNALYAKVAFTREAVLDGENLELLADKALVQVGRLVKVPRFDAQRLARCLATQCCMRRQRNNSNEVWMDWKALGYEAGICFNSVPSGVSFLNGPLQADYVPKPARQVGKRAPKPVDSEDEEDDDKVEDVKAQPGKKGKHFSEVEQNINQVKKTLKRRCDDQMQRTVHRLQQQEEQEASRHQGDHVSNKSAKRKKTTQWIQSTGREICAIQCLFNPNSFTQTVENLFYFSFLVKNEMASIRIRGNKGYTPLMDEDGHNPNKKKTKQPKRDVVAHGSSTDMHQQDDDDDDDDDIHLPPGPVICHIPQQQATSKPARQAIVSLTMKDWRNICQAYNVTQGDIPHRTIRNMVEGSTSAHKTSSSSAKGARHEAIARTNGDNDAAAADADVPMTMESDMKRQRKSVAAK